MPGIEQHHWAPYPPMVQAIESLASGLDRVLEIGPGHIPFGPATEFVDGRCRQASPAGLHLDRALLNAVQQCIGHTGAVIERFLGVPQAPADARAK
jgi:hypothetical protein